MISNKCLFSKPVRVRKEYAVKVGLVNASLVQLHWVYYRKWLKYRDTYIVYVSYVDRMGS
jgi:hypothetical protein